MSETTTTPIDTVLLATDLGFRCDRAAARAARLAARHDAPAIAATAVEPGRAQGVERVGEVAGLLGAPRGHRGGVEVDDHPASREVGERHLLTGVGGQREGGGGLPGGEAVAHGRLLSRAGRGRRYPARLAIRLPCPGVGPVGNLPG